MVRDSDGAISLQYSLLTESSYFETFQLQELYIVKWGGKMIVIGSREGFCGLVSTHKPTRRHNREQCSQSFVTLRALIRVLTLIPNRTRQTEVRMVKRCKPHQHTSTLISGLLILRWISVFEGFILRILSTQRWVMLTVWVSDWLSTCEWLLLTVCRSHGSSVSIVSDYGLDDRGSIPDRGRGFFL
jgi:hypothetical protein